MKIYCTQENLNIGLTTVNKLIVQNINLPILNNILLETKRGQLRLAATNLETGINYFVRGKIIEEGDITIPASLIANYINSLGEGRVDLESAKGELRIKTKYNRAAIRGLPASDFPFQYNLVNKIKKGTVFEIEEGRLRQGVNSVSFAAALDELRPEIAGLLFYFNQGNLILTATDSYRLAEKKVKLNKSNRKVFSVIIPIKAVQELTHILQDSEELVKIFFNEGQVLFHVRGIDFTARLVEGQYPDYKQIIPQKLSTKATADIEGLIRAVKQVSFFAARETNDIKINLDSGRGEIVFSAETSQSGRSNAKVKVEIQGPSQEVVYNYRYFLEGLSNIHSEKVYFETNGQEEPGILRGSGEQELSFLYLVMPIRN